MSSIVTGSADNSLRVWDAKSFTEIAALKGLAGRLLAGITTDRGSAYRLCRLCEEALYEGDAGCPVDHAAGAWAMPGSRFSQILRLPGAARCSGAARTPRA